MRPRATAEHFAAAAAAVSEAYNDSPDPDRELHIDSEAIAVAALEIEDEYGTDDPDAVTSAIAYAIRLGIAVGRLAPIA